MNAEWKRPDSAFIIHHSALFHSVIGFLTSLAYSMDRRMTSWRFSFTIIFSPVSPGPQQTIVAGVDSTYGILSALATKAGPFRRVRVIMASCLVRKKCPRD